MSSSHLSNWKQAEVNTPKSFSSVILSWNLTGFAGVLLMVILFRNAVDLNRRDYRAWYGLGQTYELLKMFTYALYYYKQVKF